MAPGKLWNLSPLVIAAYALLCPSIKQVTMSATVLAEMCRAGAVWWVSDVAPG